MAFKNNFFTFDDFLAILGEIRHKINHYRKEKHTMLLSDVQNMRDDLSVLNAQLSDIGADLYGDEVDTERTYRHRLLEVTGVKEEEFRNSKDERGKPWTDIANRARYAAELECKDLRVAMDTAASTNKLATNFYRVTIPKVLDSISSRIAILIRQMDTKGDFKPMEQVEEDNPWAGMTSLGFQGGLDSRMDDLEKELEELEK